MDNNYNGRNQRKKRTNALIIVIVVTALIFGAGGFAGGFFVGQNHGKNNVAANPQKGGMSPRGMQNGTMGTVTAVSDSSITISTNDGSSKTYSISSSTKVEEGQMGGPGDQASSSSSSASSSSKSISDITTGSNVAISTSSSSSSEAETISIMPAGGAQNTNASS